MDVAGMVSFFWARVKKSANPNECWQWTGAQSHHGYGRMSVWLDGQNRKVGIAPHRFAYELLVGPIAKGLEIDHLCSNKGCVNPAHLEAVAHMTNIHRGGTGKLNNYRSRKTYCSQGHPYDLLNTKWYRNKRFCRACKRRADYHYRVKQRTERGVA